MRTEQEETFVVAAQLQRPSEGPTWEPDSNLHALPFAGLPAWQSNGGPTRGHPARGLPFSFEASVGEGSSRLLRIHLVGVFALYADPAVEAFGTVGATVQLLTSDRTILGRFELVNGRHYADSKRLTPISRAIGDGTSLETLGTLEYEGDLHRIDLLTLDVQLDSRPKTLYFKDLGSPASFLCFDVFFEFAGSESGWKRSGATAVDIGELCTALRVGDRLRFAKSLELLDAAIEEADDLDSAKAQALGYYSALWSAMSEMRSSDSLSLLSTAREIDAQTSRSQVKQVLQVRISLAAQTLFPSADRPSDRLIDRALALVERHFAKDLTDAMVAAQLGLSTSHFRFLFRQATGHPFHKYVVALRLEKAKAMLLDENLPVSQVAEAVGFAGLSHFSRAFTQRFSASPTAIRRVAGPSS